MATWRAQSERIADEWRLRRKKSGDRDVSAVTALGGRVVLSLAIGFASLGCQEERDPFRPLSADEGATLMKEIRQDRGRAQELTPAEKKFLSESMRKR